MPILYEAKTLMLGVELLSCKGKPYELQLFSLETVTQVHYLYLTIFLNLKTKCLQRKTLL